jgi:hypothetical protein
MGRMRAKILKIRKASRFTIIFACKSSGKDLSQVYL